MEIGDGLLLRQGWTVAWCGWQWDVSRPGDADAPPDTAPGLLGFNAPQALDEAGRPLAGQVLLQWQPDAPVPHLMLADRIHRPYPAASLDDPAAVLSARDFRRPRHGSSPARIGASGASLKGRRRRRTSATSGWPGASSRG